MKADSKILCEKVMRDAFNGKTFRDAIKEHCDEIRSSGNKDDIFAASIYEILLEADAQWLDTQIYVVSQLLQDPQVDRWGQDNYPGWEILNHEEQMNVLFGHFAKSNALDDAREYMKNSNGVSPTESPHRYDVHAIENPISGRNPKDWSEFRQTEVFRDLRAIFLRHI